ncbi:hypothetical protein [Bradyrhizobium sp. UNPA324]|uniref:hypothetical protein n=1 Tax=Bradyrhizobium sp. UNPA324 TaxID=1141174 RepID=UPI0011534182|nr:hypothetical protein [Bradyrhizobium sp. UNPA324]TQF29704.1 hypothetical protein UNPA324_08740 [Bradyrhizobium sp. UNPA324]
MEEAFYVKHWECDTTSRQESFASALFTSARLPIRIAQLFTGEQPSSVLDYDLGGIFECGERRTISLILLIWSYS